MPKARHWLAVPLILFVAAIAIGLVAVHTNAITPHDLRLDRDIQTATRTGWFNRAMLDFANLASPLIGLVITAVITAWLLIVRHNPVRAVTTFLVIAVGWNSSEIAKIIVARHRPPTMYSLAPETGSNSFPSGHTAFAISLAIAVYFLARGTRWELTAAVVGGLWTALVGFSRLYIGAHYPTDVLGSVLVSTAAIIFLTGLWHVWIADNLYRVPLLRRFGPVPIPASVRRPEPASTAV
jgi:undecaprenyl-diphosphatase